MRLSMHGKRPVVWTGIMKWLDHAVSGRTAAEATGIEVAKPTADQQREWEDTNNYALATLDTISAHLSNFKVMETIIMRERRDSRMTRRTVVEDHGLGQETYFILQQFAGGNYEVEQALRRMTEYWQRRLMTTSSILDLCLVQTQCGHLNHFCAPEDSAWSVRVKNIVHTMLTDETKYGHLPEIIDDPFLQHLSVDVTRPSMSPIAHAQA